MKRLLIVGCGNLGGAILEGLLRTNGTWGIEVVEQNTERRRLLGGRSGVLLREALDATGIDCVLIAVKPKDVLSVLDGLKPTLSPDAFIVSVAAGISVSMMAKVVSNPIARAMPNLGAAIGQAATGVFSTSNGATRQAEEIFSMVGATIPVEREELLDAVLALGASGAGFVCAVLESFMQGAQRLGLSAEVAQKILYPTVVGTLALLDANRESPQSLRERVTTPGGTTAAGLRVFQERALAEIVSEALQAAADRAQDIGKEIAKSKS